MDAQITLRLPRELARALARRARERGVPKSRLVREALESYLAAETDTAPVAGAERIAPFLGAVRLDLAAVEADDLGRRIRRQNWRE
jgi:hypothetical protein